MPGTSSDSVQGGLWAIDAPYSIQERIPSTLVPYLDDKQSHNKRIKQSLGAP